MTKKEPQTITEKDLQVGALIKNQKFLHYNGYEITDSKKWWFWELKRLWILGFWIEKERYSTQEVLDMELELDKTPIENLLAKFSDQKEKVIKMKRKLEFIEKVIKGIVVFLTLCVMAGLIVFILLF